MNSMSLSRHTSALLTREALNRVDKKNPPAAGFCIIYFS
ncbi:Hypothetical protein EAG7_00162 [Klebsiella aerogenes]|nr:Hypothetical protein EAG7_00162 [Klebsiella aerogenes]CCG33984.1 hypothetical protein [Klebsiella aerogenes EA1509E]